MIKVVALTAEQIGTLKNIVNNEVTRLRNSRPGQDVSERMIELGEILTALSLARPAP